MKVFKRVTSKCLTSMYAFTTIFPKSTVGGFFVFIDRYLCGVAFRRLVLKYTKLNHTVCAIHIIQLVLYTYEVFVYKKWGAAAE